MSVVLWSFALLAAAAAALAASPKLRRVAFLWGSYATLTGWYYYRVLEKRHKSPTAGQAKARAGQAKSASAPSLSGSSSSSASAGSRRGADADDADVVHFESREEIERRLLRERASEGLPRASEASASASERSEAAAATPKTHLGVFRRAPSEDKRRTASEADARAEEALAASASARRTYTGRHKKPANWGE